MTTIRSSTKGFISKGNPAAMLFAGDGLEGLLLRRNILKYTNAADDERLCRQLAEHSLGSQSADGSWGGSVVRTASELCRLLDLGVPPTLPALESAKKWLLGRQQGSDAKWPGLFLDEYIGSSEAKKRGPLHRAVLADEPLIKIDASCGVTKVITTSLAIRALFRAGEDVDRNEKLALAVERIIDQTENGLPCGYRLGRVDLAEGRAASNKRAWEMPNNFISNPEDAKARNPGMMTCATHFWRSLSYSRVLSQSRYITDILADWERHQLSGGNFATSSYLYDFYYAVDTIGHFSDSRSAKSMLGKMLPLISRRQRRDGLWYRGREWLPYTYSMVKTLIRFGFMQVEVDD